MYVPNLKKKVTSSVVVKKTDSVTGESLEGAEFKLIRVKPSGESIYSTKVTNKDGIAEFNDVISGSYKIIESKAPDGYVIDNRVESFVADAYNSKAFNFEYKNKPLKLNARKVSYIARGLKKQEAKDLAKTDKSYVVSPNKMLYDVYKPLAGAKFKVINAGTGDFIEEAVSDNQGNLNLNPKLYNTSSTYKIVEVKAPDGYEPNTVGWYIGLPALQRQGIGDDGVNIILNNNPSKGRIIVSKYDKDTQKIIKDVEFTLYDKNGDKISSSRTDANGIAQFTDLSLGTYYVAETEAAPEYIQSEEKEKIKITNTNLTVIKVLYNEKKIKPSVLPTTGLNNELYIISTIFCLIAFALSLRKKKNYI